MTKEELKTDESKYIIELVIKDKLRKEAEEWLCNNLHSASEEDFIKAMVDIAEPREKQIQIDAEQIRALQKQNGELTDELKDLRESIKDYGAGCYENGLRNGRRQLEAQIEKMKSHSNCKHRSEYNEFDPYSKVCQSCCNLEKWEFGN